MTSPVDGRSDCYPVRWEEGRGPDVSRGLGLREGGGGDGPLPGSSLTYYTGSMVEGTPVVPLIVEVECRDRVGVRGGPWSSRGSECRCAWTDSSRRGGRVRGREDLEQVSGVASKELTGGRHQETGPGPAGPRAHRCRSRSRQESVGS